MKRAILVNDWISTRVAGGVYRVLGLAGGLRQLGYDVSIVTPWGVTESAEEDERWEPQARGVGSYLLTSYPVLAQTIRAISRRRGADFVLIQLPNPVTKGLSIMPVLKLLGIPVVLDIGDPWWSSGDPSAYLSVSRAVVGVQACSSALVTSCSKLILDRYFGGRRRLHVPNGFDQRLFFSRAPPGTGGGATRIGLLGSFIRRNGSELVVPILDGLVRDGYDVEMTLVGGGDQLPEILARAKERGLGGRVRTFNPVERRRVPELLSGCDILLAPYREDPELNMIFPTKVQEMMALERPVVTASLYEVLTTYDVGREVLVARYDAGDYRGLIEGLIDDPEMARGVARSGRERVDREFTWRKLAERLVAHW